MYSNGALQLCPNSSELDCFASEISAEMTKRESLELAAAILPVFYPKGGMFFLEGQPITGFFFLRAGRAKESMVSNNGRTAIVRVAGPGDILGLSAVLAGTVHESSAETLEPTHADFLRRAPFLHVLKTSSQLAQIVASQLSRNCKEAYDSIRCLGLSASVPERVARLILYWSERPMANGNPHTVGTRIRVTLTHEEISQFIGSTRETTSRVLAGLRQKKWITTQGSIWTIINKDALRRLAAV